MRGIIEQLIHLPSHAIGLLSHQRVPATKKSLTNSKRNRTKFTDEP